MHLLHDVHNRLTPIESARLGKLLEKYNLLFLEDASIAENQESYKVIRQHTTTPLAIGETYNTIWDCKELVQNQLIDYIRMAATHAGGITAMRRIADFAGIYSVKIAPHGCTGSVTNLRRGTSSLEHLGAQFWHSGVCWPR